MLVILLTLMLLLGLVQFSDTAPSKDIECLDQKKCPSNLQFVPSEEGLQLQMMFREDYQKQKQYKENAMKTTQTPTTPTSTNDLGIDVIVIIVIIVIAVIVIDVIVIAVIVIMYNMKPLHVIIKLFQIIKMILMVEIMLNTILQNIRLIIKFLIWMVNRGENPTDAVAAGAPN
ncbi:uncharacterized protein LOC143914792 [Arctopsyche grandis]|uniref:uncharacterized protein LOC143914792 n=1 Tax=Arctopsyche grandis TaxID=121162 RepID=UPI00406D967C